MLHNGYELNDVFNINTQLAGNAELKGVLGWRAYSPIRKKLYRSQLSRFRGKRMVVDTQFSSWRQINGMPNDCYLMGNWQTEYYFNDCQEAIRSDFSFRLPSTGFNAALQEQINHVVAISLQKHRLQQSLPIFQPIRSLLLQCRR